jgi:general L-amino acid transport system permease protein
LAVSHETPRAQGRTNGFLSLLYRPEVRQALWQIILFAGLVALLWMIVSNTQANLRKQNIASGLGFWERTAGFDISQSLIEYSNTSTYGRAFWVGLWNTIIVAVIGIVLATLLGFTMGIARLSQNWLIAKIASVYVELVRNIPLLLQLFIWYFAVLKNLPSPRQSYVIPGGVFLNVRGLQLPRPIAEAGLDKELITMLVGILATILIGIWAHRRRLLTGQQFPLFWTGLALIVGLPLLMFFVLGAPLSFEFPELKGFNFEGGITILPEFIALVAGLVFYTGGFISEIVRAGIMGVPKGQREASKALGLSNGQMLRLVIIPQAMRIIIPPLTSQFLNLTKNSSLAVAIAYPDLVSVFAGTVLNQTGQAVEVILITMLVYLTLSLVTSAFMNWFNARVALVER